MVYDRLLVPLGSDTDTVQTVQLATELAERWGSSVHLLRVADDGSRRPLSSVRSTADADYEVQLPTAVRDLIEDSGETVTTHTVEGTRHDAIVEYASEADIDLVVMGQDGEDGFRTRLIDSVIDKVVRRSPVPVLVVPTEERLDGQFDELLVPSNDRMITDAAIDHAATVSVELEIGAHVVEVIDLQIEAGPFDAGGVSEAFIERKKRERKPAIESVAERLGTTVTGGRYETEVVCGRLHEGIDTYVAENGVDLVVVSQYDKAGITGLLLRDVTEHLLQTVSAPVLVVPNPD